MPSTVIALIRSSALLACIACGVAACAMGPLPSSYGRDGEQARPRSDTASTGAVGDGDVHSTTCPGLLAERRERMTRIAALEKSIAVELAALPTTLAQAVLRVTGTPETGTAAYAEMMVERTHMETLSASAARLNCPPDPLPVAALKVP